MRHMSSNRKFGRNSPHRVAMLRNLSNSVILDEQVNTTVEKAKEARRIVERLITLGKRGDLNSRRIAFDRTRNDAVVAKLFDGLSGRYKARAGGYTRILKVSDRRRGDGAEMALIELVDHPMIDRKRKKPVEAAEGEDTKKSAEAAAPVDPFTRFRRMFRGSKRKKDDASKKK